MADNWNELLAEDPETADVAALLERLLAASAVTGGELTVATARTARALLIGGDEAERLLAPLAELLGRATAASPGEALGLVRAATLLTAAGRSPEPATLLAGWIDPAVDADLEDHRRTAFALACAAFRFDAAVHALAGEPLEYEPGATFGPDALGYARYIVAAVAAQAAPEDIAPAWTSFASWFPLRLQTAGLDWTDLVFAGYAAYVRLAGHEPHEVLDAIRGFVRQLA